MADPLSIAASLIAVVQISGSVIAMCYDYRRGVKGAKKDVARLLGEVQSLRNVVEQVLHLVDVDDEERLDTGYDSDSTLKDETPRRPLMPVLAQLADGGDGPIVQCLLELEAVEASLQKPMQAWKKQQKQHSHNVLSMALVLFWPLRERDVVHALDSIRRLRGIIELALSVDTAGSVLAIRQTTQMIRTSQAEAEAREKAHRRAVRRERRHERRRLQWQQVTKWLSPFAVSPQSTGFQARHHDVRLRRNNDTGQWLLDSEEFRGWLGKSNDKRDVAVSSLWLHGIPGCGKTVLASSVIDHLQSADVMGERDAQHRAAALGYFYFDFGNEAVSLTNKMLRALLLQLGFYKGDDGAPRMLPSLYRLASEHMRHDEAFSSREKGDSESDSSDLDQTYQTRCHRYNTPQFNGRELGLDDEASQPTTDELLEILHQCIRELRRPRHPRHKGRDVHIVIDALDECMDQGELLRCLGMVLSWQEDMEQTTGDYPSLPGQFRIFVTSRHTPEIAALFDSSGSCPRRHSSLLQLTPSLVQDDIDTFVRSQLATHPRLSRWPLRLRHEIQASLTAGARGMFRWADCQLGMLQKCVTVRDVRKALASLPRTLVETYTQTLNSVEPFHRSYAVRILLWLAVSPTPLELSAAADVLAVNVDDVDSGYRFDDDDRVPDIYDIPLLCTTLVRAMPGGPATMPHNAAGIELRLAHYTVKEYVLCDAFLVDFIGRNSELPPSLASIHTPALAQSHVAQTMICYLLSFQEPLTEAVLANRFLARDAAECWPYHFTRAEAHGLDGLRNMASILLCPEGDDTANEPYRNWCRLYDPTKPWRPPQLDRDKFPPPLYMASTLGLDSVVDLLLAGGADPTCGGDVHKSSLQAAAYGGHLHIVRALIAAGADPRRGGGVFTEPLIAATVAGHEEVVVELLKHDVLSGQSRHFTSDGTALMQACQHNHAGIVRHLVAAGASPDNLSRKALSPSPLTAAVKRGYLDCVTEVLPVTEHRIILYAFRQIFRQARPTTAAPQGSIATPPATPADRLPAGLDEAHARKLLRLFATRVPGLVLSAASDLGFVDMVEEMLAQPGPANVQASRPSPSKVNSTSSRRSIYRVTPSQTSGVALGIIQACADGQVDLAHKMVASGVVDIREPLYTESGVQTHALYEAVANNQLDMARFCIEHGADVDAGSTRLGPPLALAVVEQKLDMMRLLVEQGHANVNIATSKHGTPLQAAVMADGREQIDYLLEHGADVDRVPGDHDGYCFDDYRPPRTCPRSHLAYHTPLQTAIWYENEVVVERLLAAGANPNRVPPFRPNVGGIHTVNAALPFDEDNETAPCTPLGLAAYRGNRQLVEQLLAAGADIHEENLVLGDGGDRHKTPDRISRPALFWAVQATDWSADMLGALLAAGADPNAVIRNNGTETTMLAVLCEKIGVECRSALTPRRAQYTGGGKIHGDENQVKTKETETLERSDSDEALAAFVALLDAGADPTMHSRLHEFDEPPLHTLVRCAGPNTASVVAAMRALLAYAEVDIDAPAGGGEGWTALYQAARYGRADLVAALLDGIAVETPGGATTLKQANPKAELINGSTPLHAAANRNQPACLEELVRARPGRLPRPHIDHQNRSGRTPLHWAADSGSKDAVAWLLQRGGTDARIEETETGMTAQDYAMLRLQQSMQMAGQETDSSFAIESDVSNRRAVLDLFNEHMAEEGGFLVI